MGQVVVRTSSHPLGVQPSPHGGALEPKAGVIQGAKATRVPAPPRVAEKAIEANARTRREPRPLAQRSGSPEQLIQSMPRGEVLRRAQTAGGLQRAQAAGVRLRPLMRQAASALRKPKGSARFGYAGLRLAHSVLGDEIDDDDRVALLTPMDEEFGDSEQLAERLWRAENPDELAELLKAALSASELGDPQALFDKVKGFERNGRNRSALMGWLADMQAIPGKIEDRKALRAAIEDEIHELESSADTREVSFFRLAHLAEEQPNPLEFLSTCVDVAQKEPSTWVELLRSILQGHPSGASSSETLKGTVRNLILGLGVEMQAIRDVFDKARLKIVTAQLQRVYTLHSLIDDLFGLSGEVDRSIALQGVTGAAAGA